MDDILVKNLRDYQRGELAQELLRLISVAEKALEKSEQLDALSVIEKFRPESRDERNRVWKAIKYLEEQNRIQLQKKGNRHYMYMTETGEMKLAEEEIWELAIRPQKKWDGVWRLVLCEVPVSLSRNRALFREKLADMGLREYQQSVYISPHDCFKEVEAIAEWCGIFDYVRFVKATEVSDSEILKKEFGV
jgi:DNA-binding transcriptional regulator PaaX